MKIKNTQFFNCRALSYYFPLLFFLAEKEVHIMSPWVTNVTLHPPVNPYFEETEVQLFDFLEKMVRVSNKRIYLYTRKRDRVAQLIRLEPHINVNYIENIHIKAIVTDTLSYIGSANITFGGFYKNIEGCMLFETPKPVDKFVRNLIFQQC